MQELVMVAKGRQILPAASYGAKLMGAVFIEM